MQAPPPLPIHERSVPVNPQNDCPLFNVIPPEIRDEIFKYALAETIKTDILSTSSENSSRPGYTGKRTIAIPLLQTCRRIYLETYDLPVHNREHVFWHAPERGPHGHHFPNPHPLAHEEWYFRLMTSWQLKLVKEVHLFTQMYWLEGQFIGLCGQMYMSNVEKLKLTIRRGDWWWNERNVALYIHPKRTIRSAGEMLVSINQEKTNSPEAFLENAWGSAFKRLPSLKELEIEFETSDDKKAELEQIVDWAKTWKFPMKDGKVLSADGLDVKKKSWEGGMTFWSDRCPYCGSHNRVPCVNARTPDEKKECVERTERRSHGRGPTLHIMNVRWGLDKGAKGDVGTMVRSLDP
ncbi:hypothetical protein BDZ45DRAFT_661257 [Acephala macrosclerotiorum]|nr:hypothetical protein BDZ45DRAFT_661257 [Acephala macrosclerotiorum]